VETIGATRLSRSHPKRTASSVSTVVATRTTALASVPPRIETNARSNTLGESEIPSPTTSTAVPRAISSEMAMVSAIEATTFWAKRLSRRIEKRNVPRWTLVESRLPSAENTLPRSPMAAGTSTISSALGTPPM
jgi:hypothetical protein